MIEKRYVKAQEIPELQGRDEVFLVCLYDRLAKESSSILTMKNLDLVPRMFKNSIGNLDPFEVEVCVLAVYDTANLTIKPVDAFIEMNDYKSQLKKDLENETSKR